MGRNETLNSEIDRSKKRRIRKSKGLFLILTVTVFFFIITSSIAAPVLIRDFYYAQIDDLELVKDTGYTEEEIRTAYGEVMDYCIGMRSDFAVGRLGYSEEGKQHFEDCRGLFILDLGVLAVTALVLVIWILIRKAVSMRSVLVKGYGPAFWGSVSTLVVFVTVGCLGAIDFDKAFVVFHKIFFPGKSNWLFDPKIDEVIRILPETFFMRCAILIVGLILLQCLVLIFAELIGRRKRHVKRKK